MGRKLVGIVVACMTLVAFVTFGAIIALSGGDGGPGLKNSGVELATAQGDDSAAPASDNSLRNHGYEVDVHSLPWAELIMESDIVVVADVAAQRANQKIDAGNSALKGVAVTYEIKAEAYLKGSGDDSFLFTKIVGYDYSGGESDVQEAYSVGIDSPTPLTTDARYLLALSQYEGRWYGTAEPFRFRLSDGLAVAESGMLDDSFLEQRFPSKPESDLIAEIEALVAAQAAEAAAR